MSVCLGSVTGSNAGGTMILSTLGTGDLARIASDARFKLITSCDVALALVTPAAVNASSYVFRKASGLRSSPALAIVSCNTLVRVASVSASLSVTCLASAVSCAESCFKAVCASDRSAKSVSC